MEGKVVASVSSLSNIYLTEAYYYILDVSMNYLAIWENDLALM